MREPSASLLPMSAAPVTPHRSEADRVGRP
uniref:Uncharacterized protein n=1 Tax=Arundo donax TaxID=35708 RepID=A0A0A8ZA80_ARUDO